ncbi:unnamed protein product [Porites lobata]|uniref:Uncharacterized protein n=1 Tax=Porites lobata TaxID=104759 RepID=A0ABN8Q8U4_9CNID|nr:unnamed protein product [Porites lobata]
MALFLQRVQTVGFIGQMSLHNFENTRRNAHRSNTENRKEFRHQFLNTLPSKSLVSPVSDKTVTNILRLVSSHLPCSSWASTSFEVVNNPEILSACS